MKLNLFKSPGRSVAVWIWFFLLSFAVARADDFATIQNNLLVSTSAAWVPISYAGLKTLNPTTYEDCLDVTQVPTQALVTDAMTINTSTGLYADIVYTKTGGKPEYRMNHFRRLLILGLAYRNAPNSYSQTSTAIKTALIKGLTAWVNFFSTSLYGTAFQDSVIWAPGFYPNSYGAVVLLVPDLIKANTTLWADSIAYLTKYYHIDNTFAANAQAPYRARLMGYVLSGNTTAAAELTADFLSVELNCSSRKNDFWKTPPDAKQDLVEGFHPDYSFQQHSGGGRTNYWGHYGAGFVRNMPALLRLTAGTSYSLKSSIPFLTTAIVEGFQWSYYSYHCIDLQTTGRSYNSIGTIDAIQKSIKQLAEIAGAATAGEVADTASQAALTTVYQRINGKPTTLRGDKMFWRADFHVHRGNGWGTSVRMSSTRTVACESDGYSSGRNNHYTGSGALYLLQDGYEYKGVVSGEQDDPGSPYWDWRRLPGITVEQYPKATTLPDHLWGDGSNGGKTFAGGASDGTYGVVGYQHYLADTTGSQPVTAYKAAFFFDNEYVMAGAGITQANGTHQVVTTINQTKLVPNTRGSAISYYANGSLTGLPLSDSQTANKFPSGGAWVLSGNTGYVFPVSGHTFSFQQLYTSTLPTPSTDDLFWLGVEHGTNPTDATYCCIVRPNSNEADLANYMANPDIVVAANTPQAQGVFGPNQVFQAIYYKKGIISGTSWLRTVAVDQPCALILRPDSVTSTTKLILTVSNPQCESVPISNVTVDIKTEYCIAGSTLNTDGTYSFKVVVNLPTTLGENGKSKSIDLPLVTTPAPVITSSLTATATRGQAFTYQIKVSKSPASYSASGLPAGLTVNASSGVISGTPTTAGTYTATIQATNGAGTGNAVLTITVVPPVPAITSNLTATVITGEAFNYKITGSNSPTSYSATGLPDWLSVNALSGVISGTPTVAAGTYTVTIRANNADGSGSANLAIAVVPPVPVVTSSLTAKTAKIGQVFSDYRITASNTPTRYYATKLPEGLSVNTNTGIISGTPTAKAVTSVVTIGASNAGGVGSASLTIAFPPVLTSPFTAIATSGQPFSYQITGSNTPGPGSNTPATYSATSLPTGLSVNTSTGLISGTFSSATGTFKVPIGVANAAGSSSANLTITVATPALDIVSRLTETATTGQAFSYLITGSNTPTSYSAFGLPAGLIVSTTTGEISGKPTTAGTYTLTIRAINASGGSGSASLTITVLPVAPVISGVLTATATTGQLFTYRITASNIPTSYSATPLPAGLSVEASSGIISGTPTSATGTYTVTIGATNDGGSSRSASLTITVVPPAPVITSDLTATAIIGQAFNYQISGSNSPTIYSATGFPAGLSVDTKGVISGTPTSAAGPYNATIGASNAGGLGTAILKITVATPITALESVPPTLTIAGSIAQLRVGNSVKGHWYQLQKTTDLSATTVWENIGNPTEGTNGVLELSDDSGMTGPRVFYRLKISVTAL